MLRTTAIIATTGAALAGLLASCTAQPRDPAMAAAASATGQRACFYAPHTRGFREGPGGSIVVNTSSKDYYALQPYHPCGNIHNKLGVRMRARVGGYICEGYDADLYIPGPLGLEYCPVRAVRKLTEAEIVALRSKPR